MLPFQLLREAERELELARKWYDEQRHGLGLVFFWRHFVARCAARGDDRAIRLVQRRECERSGWDLDRGA